MKQLRLNPEDLQVATFETEAARLQAFYVVPLETEHTEDKLCTETACKPPEDGRFAIAC